MKNFVQPGKHLTLDTSACVAPNSPAKSGDPVVAGRVGGVASIDGVASGKTVIQVEGVFNLSVSSVHNGLSVGETVYIDPANAVLSDDLNDVPYGIALGVVAMGTTAAIDVRLFGATPGASGANS